jgi:glycogen synthase kinase 3 beta
MASEYVTPRIFGLHELMVP